MAKNYYDILGVDKNFDEDTLKKAYKKACLKYHPDRMAGKSDAEKHDAEERFKDIQEAYECLSDADKRNYYDRTGSMDGYGQGWSAGANFGGFSDFFSNMGDMFDFGGFGQHFGFGQNNTKRDNVQPGKNLKLTVGVNIEELFKGGTKRFKYRRDVRCEHCHGAGGEGVETCPHCKGTGMYTTVQRSGWGMIQNSRPCPYCNATGKTVKKRCTHCDGTGFKTIDDEVEVKIPVFVPNGYTTQMSGKGFEAKTPGAPDGNLLIQFYHEIDNEKYIIDEKTGDVYERISVPYYDCILGKTLKRTLPNGVSVYVKIPEYSDDTTQVRLKNKGLRNHDYVYVIAPEFPKKIDKKEREELKNIRNIHE